MQSIDGTEAVGHHPPLRTSLHSGRLAQSLVGNVQFDACEFRKHDEQIRLLLPVSGRSAVMRRYMLALGSLHEYAQSELELERSLSWKDVTADTHLDGLSRRDRSGRRHDGLLCRRRKYGDGE